MVVSLSHTTFRISPSVPTLCSPTLMCSPTLTSLLPNTSQDPITHSSSSSAPWSLCSFCCCRQMRMPVAATAVAMMAAMMPPMMPPVAPAPAVLGDSVRMKKTRGLLRGPHSYCFQLHSSDTTDTNLSKWLFRDRVSLCSHSRPGTTHRPGWP